MDVGLSKVVCCVTNASVASYSCTAAFAAVRVKATRNWLELYGDESYVVIPALEVSTVSALN
jgi:hypothetical protein